MQPAEVGEAGGGGAMDTGGGAAGGAGGAHDAAGCGGATGGGPCACEAAGRMASSNVRNGAVEGSGSSVAVLGFAPSSLKSS